MSTKKGKYGNPANRKPVQAGDLYSRAQPSGITDPRTVGGSMTGDLGDSSARHAVVIDMHDAVLMTGFTVAEVETVRDGAWQGRVAFMEIDGRINKTDRLVKMGVVGNTDAVAGIITELLALAYRSGPEFLDDVTRRLTELHQGKHVDLHWLRGAIDNAIASTEPDLIPDLAAKVCGDYPAPCNCDDPTTHNGR